MPDTKDFDDIPREVIKELPYQYFEQMYVRKVHHYYLSSTIDEPRYYTEMIHQIRSAIPEDAVHIHLNIQGGNMSTGIQIINAIQSSEAHIICSLEAEAYSLGTLIFLVADEFIVHDNCVMLFHNFSGGTTGKGNEQLSQLQATITWFNTIAKNIYIPFLSEEELEVILKDEDLWMHTDEIRSRLDNMVKIMEQEEKEQEEKELAEEESKKPPRKKSTKTTQNK